MQPNGSSPFAGKWLWRRSEERMKKFGKGPSQIHFVGIGGVGMSGIAEVLITLGHRVSGSDIVETAVSRRLTGLGARITYGHDAAAVNEEISVVVISSAVKFSNPEVIRARELRIPVTRVPGAPRRWSGGAWCTPPEPRGCRPPPTTGSPRPTRATARS
jgi:hypothetical protein